MKLLLLILLRGGARTSTVAVFIKAFRQLGSTLLRHAVLRSTAEGRESETFAIVALASDALVFADAVLNIAFTAA